MKNYLSFVALVAVFCAVDAGYMRSPPKVQLYSRDPGLFGKGNVLICHVSQFHPPDITITLLKGDAPLDNAQQTDLAFKQDWHFHLTNSAPFTPESGVKFTCRVNHGGRVTDYVWDPNM
ncbi:beta-2-microglobulin-like [Boleophthalmus pectinirostris]|uniref:beta-2-microglobulin-like n=1 Tax=Boleophthalmus pectinirostris TaxID=150288 RepID=UPI000A1C5B05|nr:beta-2-microglobulin-like [Boleophthalmus pectinirostris]